MKELRIKVNEEDSVSITLSPEYYEKAQRYIKNYPEQKGVELLYEMCRTLFPKEAKEAEKELMDQVGESVIPRGTAIQSINDYE